MKNIFKIVIALLSVLFVSCNADAVDNRPILEGLTVPNITAPTTGKTFVLAEANATTEVDKFVWSPAEYSHDVVVNYTLMMDVKGGDFSEPQILATTSDVTEASVSVKTLNQAGIALGAVPGTASQYDIKVKYNVMGTETMVSQNTLTVTITAYSGLVPYPHTDWYLVGDATAAGWDTNKGNQPLFRSGSNSNLYKFTGYFNAGYFKVISKLGSWAPMYGGSGGSLVYRATDSDGDPASINIATAGYYTFTMNVQTLTYTLVAYDASAATVYPTVGLIGSSRTGTGAGWDEDTDMTPSSFNPHYWTLTVSLFDGETKFRANNGWDVNWGGDTAFSGFPANGTSGGNIPVAKSKYKVFFNDLDGSYLMIPNQQ
ncbi:SusE domain-containing protein [Flavobacterium flavipallidum]|uniref:SusE domain-containing protein n=1 Tax=Flavobacterium flavipallidum TaxID=3139140 RepID=A0ABU9HN51_9FLAO